ncbi:hypothetical protein DPMN_013707 [Dreissena polymorpha]|uniref:Uncharacterized protein n=1 Tax=Dreissena polymorpha TaxID=45954 RepID=A0A9D4NAB2_DREPO|nr:hypothetical protein DPMN_013707 [Dreissena polymorpha]
MKKFQALCHTARRYASLLYRTEGWTHNDLVRKLAGPGSAMRLDGSLQSLGARQEPVDIDWK